MLHHLIIATDVSEEFAALFLDCIYPEYEGSKLL
jgi:hypothetical protein